MVDDFDFTIRAQASGSMPTASSHASPANASRTYAQALSDVVVLSARAREVIGHLSEGKTITEAWIEHVIALPDPAQRASRSSGDGQENGKAALQASMNATVNDIGWLLDALNPPKVDISLVTQVLAARMSADNVVASPLPEIVSRAQRSDSAPALHVENLSVTVQNNQVVHASVGRVVLTTVHDTLRERIATRDQPLVLDVGGSLQQVASNALGNAPTDQVSITPEAHSKPKAPIINASSPDSGLRTDDPRHALLIVRQHTALPLEDSMTVKLDALFPIE